MPQRILTAYSRPDEPTMWYPLSPRWILLLRLVGVLGVLYAAYAINLERPHSPAAVFRLVGAPAIFILYCFCVQPKRRVRTFLTGLGAIAHWLLVLSMFPIAVFVVLTWLR